MEETTTDPTWVLPEPLCTFDVMLEDGAVTRLRQHGTPSQPLRLVLSHGSGFAIDGYLPFWRLLLHRFEVVLLDHRNHGHNPPSDPERHHYMQLGRDLTPILQGIAQALGAKPTVGVFHSMSGRAALLHAVEWGWMWDALVLFDPPMAPPPGHSIHHLMRGHGDRLVDWARKRRARFTDPGQLAEVFKRLRLHRHWVAGAHDLMARSMLRQEPESGAWVLVCPPELEAAMYLSNRRLNLWPQASDIGGPTILIGADPTLPQAGTPALTNQALGQSNGFRYTAIAGAGHMLQLEQPEACIQAMLAFLQEVGLLEA